MKNRIEQKSAGDISSSVQTTASLNTIGTTPETKFFERTNYSETLVKTPTKPILNDIPKYERSETKIEKAFRNQAKKEPEPPQNPERSNSRLAKVFSKTPTLKSQKKSNQSAANKSFAKIGSSVLPPKNTETPPLSKKEEKYSVKPAKGIEIKTQVYSAIITLSNDLILLMRFYTIIIVNIKKLNLPNLIIISIVILLFNVITVGSSSTL